MSTFSKPQNIIKCSIGGGKKGTLLIQKTSLTRRRYHSASLVAANETKKRKREEFTMKSPVLVETPCRFLIVPPVSEGIVGMPSLTQESTRYKKHGVFF